MKGIKNWLVSALGGITEDDFTQALEMQREAHESWAVEYLTGKNGEVTPNYMMYKPFYGDDIVVVRSRVQILGECIKGLKVAPWCREITTEGLHIISEKFEDNMYKLDN